MKESQKSNAAQDFNDVNAPNQPDTENQDWKREIKEKTAIAEKTLLSALHELGIKAEVHPENGKIMFNCGHLHIEAACYSYRTFFVAASWTAIKADDPMLPRLKEAINHANFDLNAPTCMYSGPQEDGNVLFHMRYDTILHPQLPYITDLISGVINAFYKAIKDILEFARNGEGHPEDY